MGISQVRPKGTEPFGTKVEIKNMNNLTNMQKAIEFEMDRQVRRAGKVGLKSAGCKLKARPSPRLIDRVDQVREGR